MTSALAGADDPFGPPPIDPDPVCNPSVPDPPDIDPPAGEVAAGTGGVGQLLILLLVLLLVAALAWVFWQWWSSRHGSSKRPGDVDEDDLDADEDVDGPLRIIDEERPPDRWRRVAAEHRSNGEFRDAIRCEYRALVGDLARAGLVDEIPGRTSGEERAQIADLAGTDAPVTAQFAVAADVFDVAWFDDRPTTAADDERFLAAQRVVLESTLVGGRAR